MTFEQTYCVVAGALVIITLVFVAGYNIGRLVEKVDWYENHTCKGEAEDYETDPGDDPDDGERVGVGGFPRSILEGEKVRAA